MFIFLYKQNLNKSGIRYILHLKIISVKFLVILSLLLFNFLNRYLRNGVVLPSNINSGDIILKIFISFLEKVIRAMILIMNLIIRFIYLSIDNINDGNDDESLKKNPITIVCLDNSTIVVGDYDGCISLWG